MQKKLSVLIVEDETDIAANIGDFFSLQGLNTDFAYSGTQAIELALTHFYDVIVLDVMLPGMDGLQVCEHLRQISERHIPIIMLTARDTLDDTLAGFSTGADDYLTKPFALTELYARVNALSQRHMLSNNHLLEIGDLAINRRTQHVYRKQQKINLSNLNYRILLAIAEAYPMPLNRSALISKIWAEDCPESDALRSHIYQIRQQLDKPFEFEMLHTLHSVGFVLKESPTC